MCKRCDEFKEKYPYSIELGKHVVYILLYDSKQGLDTER